MMGRILPFKARPSRVLGALSRASIVERAQLRNAARRGLRKARLAQACLLVAFVNLLCFVAFGAPVAFIGAVTASAGSVASVRDARWQRDRIVSALAVIEARS